MALGIYKEPKPAEVDPWNTEDAKLRRECYAHGLNDGLSAVKPAERWVIDMRYKDSLNDPWEPSGDSDVRGEFPSKAAADAAIAKNKATTVVRRARRID